MPPTVIHTLVGAIPAEEGASYVAHVGEPGRITSRAGSVHLGSAPLTVAAIDDLHARIFPPDQLQSLAHTGLALFDFSLPGVDGMFTALAGSSPGDRWLDIRRRSAKTPPQGHLALVLPAAAQPPVAAPAVPAPPAAAAPAAAPPPAAHPPVAHLIDAITAGPQATPAAAGGDDPFDLAGLEITAPGPARVQSMAGTIAPPHAMRAAHAAEDLTDLASLEFPASGMDADPGALAVSEDLFEGAREPRRSNDTSWDRARDETLDPPTARRRFRVGRPVAACLGAALLVAGYFGATQFLSAGSSGVVQPQPAPRSAPPPARANATTPAPQPQQQPQPPNAAPPQQVSTAAAQPQTASAAPAAAASQPTPAAATPQATSPARTATASAPPAATPDTPVRSGFSVQVAAVRTREEGDRMVTRFVTQGYPAYLVRGEGAAASYFRVRIGGFPDRKAAEAVAKQLEGTEGIKGWIVNEVPENKSAAAQTPRKDEHSIGR